MRWSNCVILALVIPRNVQMPSLVHQLNVTTPIGVLSLCRLAEPTAHTHAGEAGFHNVDVVGRAALPAGANGACRAQRTGGADLAAGGHATVVKGTARHKTLAPGIGCGA